MPKDALTYLSYIVAFRSVMTSCIIIYNTIMASVKKFRVRLGTGSRSAVLVRLLKIKTYTADCNWAHAE